MSVVPRSLSGQDLAAVHWPPAEPIAAVRVLSGRPVATTLVTARDEFFEVGLWQVSPGEFTTVHAGYQEFIYIIAGRGALIDDQGQRTELEPGVACAMGEGWTGRWVVDEELTKTYTLIYDAN
jgi:uncharacterized cupin superfamily protein